MSGAIDLVAHAAEFPASYKLKMIRAYRTIAQMDADEEYFATPADRDAAFENVLRAKNLRRTHEMFLAEVWERAALREHLDAVTDKRGHLALGKPCDRNGYTGGPTMTDPAVDAAQRAMRHDPHRGTSLYDIAEIRVNAAREALKPIRERMTLVRDRYENVERMMLAAESPAETSRHANEMAGIKFAYDLLAPLIYTSEELEP